MAAASASPFGIHGKSLEITVLACHKLKNTELLSRQDPYVLLDYASTKHRTKTCTDGGKNPTFGDKFTITLIEGVREIDIGVWNSNTLTAHKFIGSGTIPLKRVLCDGYEDATISIQTLQGRHAGEVKLIMRYSQTPVQNAGRRNEDWPPQFSHGGPHVPPYSSTCVPQCHFAPPNTYTQPSPFNPTSYQPTPGSCAYCCPSAPYPQPYPPPQFPNPPQGYAPVALSPPIIPPSALPVYPPSAPSLSPPYCTMQYNGHT